MFQASPNTPIVAVRRVFGVRRHPWRATIPLVTDLDGLEGEAAADSTLVQDLTYFAACYAAGLVFFLIMLT
jgi:hypothetical protein